MWVQQKNFSPSKKWLRLRNPIIKPLSELHSRQKVVAFSQNFPTVIKASRGYIIRSNNIVIRRLITAVFKLINKQYIGNNKSFIHNIFFIFFYLKKIQADQKRMIHLGEYTNYFYLVDNIEYYKFCDERSTSSRPRVQINQTRSTTNCIRTDISLPTLLPAITPMSTAQH